MAGIRFFSTFAPNYAKIKEMNIDFDKCGGLVPAIVQDANTRKVLMLGYMDKEAFDKTIKTKKVTFWSRSRQCLWTKGETSGNFLNMVDIKIDCDNDTLLVQAIPDGPTCHTGTDTCWGETNDGFDLAFLKELQDFIDKRKEQMPEGSYTTSLFKDGVNRIARRWEKKHWKQSSRPLTAARKSWYMRLRI